MNIGITIKPMRLNKILVLLSVVLSSTAAFSQQGRQMTPGDIYRSATGRARSPQEVAAMRRVYNDQLRNAQFERLHAGPRSAAGPPSSDSSVDRERRQLIRHLRHRERPRSRVIFRRTIFSSGSISSNAIQDDTRPRKIVSLMQSLGSWKRACPVCVRRSR